MSRLRKKGCLRAKVTPSGDLVVGNYTTIRSRLENRMTIRKRLFMSKAKWEERRKRMKEAQSRTQQ